MNSRWRHALAAVTFVIAMGMTPAAFAQVATGTPAAAPVVVREVLSEGEPAATPGRILQLVRFTIPAHLKLPAHTHPGIQTAWLESGALQYTVVEGGPVVVTRGAALNGTPAPTAMLSDGQTTTFQPGDSWAEREGMVHFAENVGSGPVIILVASLLIAGAPPANVVAAATPAP